MSTEGFVRELVAMDVRVSLKGDRLVLNAAEGVLTDHLRAKIADRKAEIVAWLREVQGSTRDLVLRPAPRNAPLPLSFGQENLWFLHRLNPANSAYHIAFSVDFGATVESDPLRASLEHIVRRHDILRTVFADRDGAPFQIVTDQIPTLELLDLRSDAPAEAEAAIQRMVNRPFDPAAAPPLRAALVFRSEPDRSQLIVVIHHLLADGWSLGVFAYELRELYEGFQGGHQPRLPGLRWQYADFAYSQRIWAEATDQAVAEGYWQRKLAGYRAFELPVDHPRNPTATPRGAVEQFRLSAPIAGQLRSLARESGTTLFATLLGVFNILLSRYCGQNDLVVGMPIANRNSADLEPLIGMFVSTVAVRTDLSNDPTFRQVIQQVRDTLLEAHDHQDYPFDKVIDLIQPERRLGQAPVFQAVCVLLNTPFNKAFETIGTGAPFDLSLYFSDGGEDLPGSIDYDANLFDPGTIARVVGHLRTLATAAVANPDRPISELPMVTAPERVQLLDTWNRTQVPYPHNRLVHSLFEEQAAARPAAIAVTMPSLEPGGVAVDLTYRALDERANALAHRWRAQGLKPRATVGVVLDRSLDFVVAALAVLKAGGAYVPIDPRLPTERLAFLIEDAEIGWLITRTELRRQLPPTSATVVSIDPDPVEPGPSPRLPEFVAADGPAYIMYTSGSTGRPKGVCVPHRAIVRLVRNPDYVSLTDREVVLACAPVSFDASTFEIWGALLNGGRLVICPAPIPTPDDLATLCFQYAVSTLWLTAGLFHLMVDVRPDALRGLRQLLAGGDVLSPAHAKRALRAMPNGVLINGYGPTENTTFTCCFRMTDEHHIGTTVPIGRPIANTRVYVLDAGLQPVPIGVWGELWAGGDGVALGYLNDAERTAERFRRDPFSSAPNARIYQTGDVVRYRSDGVLEFRGRADRQLKIRGFRIEPGEVEVVLCRHPSVREAVVTVHERVAGNKQLTAYVVPAPHHAIDPTAVRQFAREHLPDYAVPSTVLVAAAIPLTQNGKVDYRRLPLPTANPIRRDTPPNALEARLLDVWRDVLGVNDLGLDDNFFDLGGNSLLGVRLLVQLEKVLGRLVPVAMLFDGQTVESMARLLEGATVEESSQQVVAIQAKGTRPPVFFVPGVSGDILGFELLARALGPDQPVYGLRSVGLDGRAEPLTTVEDIAKVFVHEIRRVQPQGPYRILGLCMGGVIAYEMAQQLLAQGQKTDLLGLIDTWPPALIPPKRATTRWAQQLIFFGEGTMRHGRALLRTSPRQWPALVRRNLGILAEVVMRRDMYRGDRQTLGRDLVIRVNQRAANIYSPLPYPGPVFLVVTDREKRWSGPDPRLMWETLAGQTTVIQVHGTDSGALLKPPYVSDFAAALDAHLSPRPS